MFTESLYSSKQQLATWMHECWFVCAKIAPIVVEGPTALAWFKPGSWLGWEKRASSTTDSGLVPPAFSTSLPPAATTGGVWQPGTHTSANVLRATEGLCATARMILPVCAQPSSATMDSARSQIKGNPPACASLALVGSTVNKVSLVSSWG